MKNTRRYKKMEINKNLEDMEERENETKREYLDSSRIIYLHSWGKLPCQDLQRRHDHYYHL